MKSLRCLLLVFGLASLARAQTASLAASQTTLSPGGGTVVLTASANYEDEPGALGWAIALPADWTLVSVAGPHAPQIAPQNGSTGTLEFAYTAVPAQRAEFSVTVRYPANAANAAATPTVIVRRGGKLATLAPAPVQLRAADSATLRKSKD